MTCTAPCMKIKANEDIRSALQMGIIAEYRILKLMSVCCLAVPERVLADMSYV